MDLEQALGIADECNDSEVDTKTALFAAEKLAEEVRRMHHIFDMGEAAEAEHVDALSVLATEVRHLRNMLRLAQSARRDEAAVDTGAARADHRRHNDMTYVKVRRYSDPAAGFLGYIEPDDRSWIVYVGLDNTPLFFAHRGEDGGVLCEGMGQHNVPKHGV